jgi:hypothetical protein
MSVFSENVRLYCGVPDVEEIPPLPEIVGCSVGTIPILPPHDFYPPIDGPPGCDGINGLDGQDGHDGIDGLSGSDGADGQNGLDGIDGADGIDGQNGTDGFEGPPGKDGMDGVDGLDGRNGCDGLNGVDGQDGHDGRDGEAGCNGIDGLDGQDGADGMPGDIPFDRFIWDGCLAVAADDEASVVRVRPNCDTSNEIIDVIVPYPSDFKAVPAGWPVRYYEARNGRYILLDLPCPK